MTNKPAIQKPTDDHRFQPWSFGDDPTPRVRFWWRMTLILAPLIRVGIHKPHAWAHVRYLREYCAMVEDRTSRFLT